MDINHTKNLLVSRSLFKIAQAPTTTPTISLLPTTFQPDYPGTADVLCWGSFT
jgi:hypothetical protein